VKNLIATVSILAASTMVAPTLASAQDAFSADQKAEIKQMIEQYIAENPKAVLDSLEDYRMKELQRVENEAKEKAAQMAESFKTDKSYPTAGNPDGDIVVVEFFDYSCGYCKKAITAVQEITSSQKDIKVVFIELPILGESSLLAAKWALASQKQDKYFEFHQALMEFRGQKTEEELSKIATGLGMDVEKLKADANEDEIQMALDKNRELAESIGVSGTPAFIIGDQVVRGYVPYATMEGMIEEIRNAEKEG